MRPRQGNHIEGDVEAIDAAGVTIIAQKKSDDGLMHPAVCGGITGQINLYEIPAQSLGTAQGLGFEDFARDALPK